MAIKVWNCFGLIGGTTRDLDAIPIATLTNQDRAITSDGEELFIHEFDANGTDDEASPTVIQPDDFSTAGVWNIIKGPLELPSLAVEGNAGTEIILDCVNNDTFLFTCDQSALTITLSGLSVGSTAALVITGGDNCTITWPADVQWPGAAEPELSSGTDRIVIQRITAGIVHASLAGQEYA